MNQSDEQEKTDSTSPWKVLFLSLSAYVVVSSLVIVAFVSFFGVDKWSDIANTASTIVQATLAAAVIFGASMAVVAYASRAEKLMAQQKDIMEGQRAAHAKMASIVTIQALSSAVDVVMANVATEIKLLTDILSDLHRIIGRPVAIVQIVYNEVVSIRMERPPKDEEERRIDAFLKERAFPIDNLIEELLSFMNKMVTASSLPISGYLVARYVCDEFLIKKIRMRISSTNPDPLFLSLFGKDKSDDEMKHMATSKFHVLIDILRNDPLRAVLKNDGSLTNTLKKVMMLSCSPGITDEEVWSHIQNDMCCILSNSGDQLMMTIAANYIKYSSTIISESYERLIDMATGAINDKTGGIEQRDEDANRMAEELKKYLSNFYCTTRTREDTDPNLLGFFCG